MPGLRPRFRLAINGEPLPRGVEDRVVSITIVDRDGTRSDSLTVNLADDPDRPFALPETDATLTAWGGYPSDADGEAGLARFGDYRVTDLSIQCFPHSLEIKATSPSVKHDLKTHQNRHWDNTTLGAVYADLAGGSGLALRIDPVVAAIQPPGGYLAMEGESALAFGERIAARNGAIFAVKDGVMVVAVRGAAISVSGKTLPALVIRPRNMIAGCSADISGREKVGKVSADHHDRARAKRQTVTVEGDPASATGHSLRHTYGDELEAKRAAAAAAAQLKSGEVTTRVKIIGDPTVRAGQSMKYADVRPGLDGREFVIESATHRYSATGGYVTEIEAKAKAAGTARPVEESGSGGAAPASAEAPSPRPELDPVSGEPVERPARYVPPVAPGAEIDPETGATLFPDEY